MPAIVTPGVAHAWAGVYRCDECAGVFALGADEGFEIDARQTNMRGETVAIYLACPCCDNKRAFHTKDRIIL